MCKYFDCHKIIPSVKDQVMIHTTTHNGVRIAEGFVRSVTTNTIDYFCNTPINTNIGESEYVYSRIKHTGDSSIYIKSKISFQNNKVILEDVELVSQNEQRAANRMPIQMNVMISIEARKNLGEFNGYIDNISTSGILLKTDTRLGVGDIINISIIQDEKISSYKIEFPTLKYRVMRRATFNSYGCQGLYEKDIVQLIQKLITSYEYNKLIEAMRNKHVNKSNE